VSPPKQQSPRFFLDRSLGRKAVPEGLRMDGWDIVTAIFAAVAGTGPYIYSVQLDRLSRLYP
jgi:hypothetical protein